MFSNGLLDFFYAAHNQMAGTVINMTDSLTHPNGDEAGSQG